MQYKNKIKLSLLVEYLESKIISSIHNQKEYELYSNYKWHGKKVFRDREYANTIRKLINEIGEGGFF